MDELDRAEKEVEFFQEKQIAEAHMKAGILEAKETGFCLNCGDPVEKGRRWCCAECRDEWELRRKRGVR